MSDQSRKSFDLYNILVKKNYNTYLCSSSNFFKRFCLKIVYGKKGQVTQDNSEKAVRGKEVTLQESLKPIIEKMLNEHYNH